MVRKSQTQDTSTPTIKDPFNAFSQLQEAGLGNMMGLSTAWVEAISDMGAEVASFVAERIRQDVKTQHQILHCRNVAEMQHIQAQFVQKALDQYQAETGKLIQMGTDAFAAAKTVKSS